MGKTASRATPKATQEESAPTPTKAENRTAALLRAESKEKRLPRILLAAGGALYLGALGAYQYAIENAPKLIYTEQLIPNIFPGGTFFTGANGESLTLNEVTASGAYVSQTCPSPGASGIPVFIPQGGSFTFTCNGINYAVSVPEINSQLDWAHIFVNGVQQYYGLALVGELSNASPEFQLASALVTILSLAGSISLFSGIGLIIYRKLQNKTIKKIQQGWPLSRALGRSFEGRVNYLEKSERRAERIISAVAEQARKKQYRLEALKELGKLAAADKNFSPLVIEQLERLAITGKENLAKRATETLEHVHSISDLAEKVETSLQRIADSDSKAAELAREILGNLRAKTHVSDSIGVVPEGAVA